MESSLVQVLVVARSDRWRGGLRALLETLRQVGSIDQADDGRSALRIIAEGHPTLVLLDAGLPEDEVGAVLRQVESARQQLMAQAAGADGALRKGFAAEALFAAIDEVLRRIE